MQNNNEMQKISSHIRWCEQQNSFYPEALKIQQQNIENLKFHKAIEHLQQLP